MKFTIFYENGDTVEGDDSEMVDITLKAPKAWLDAPDDGVQGVIYEGPNGKTQQMHGYDFIYPTGDSFNGNNDMSCFIRYHLKGMLKFGLCVSDSHWKEHEQRMKDYKWKFYQEKVKPIKNG